MPGWSGSDFYSPWTRQKPWGMATSVASETKVPPRSSLWEVSWKQGSGKEVQASTGTMYEKQWSTDPGMHQKGQAFTITYRQVKTSLRKLRMNRKRINTINTFLNLNPSPPTPHKCELRTHAKGLLKAFSPLLCPNPVFLCRIPGSGIPLMPNLSRCYSFSPGPKAIWKNPILKIFQN